MTDKNNIEAEALRELCRGHEPDAGWVEDENGNWIPCISDRRRIVVAKLLLMALIFGGMAPLVAVSKMLEEQSTDEEDLEKLTKAFEAFIGKGQAGL